MPEGLQITIDGRNFKVREGTTVAAAVLNAGQSAFRRSVTGAPRGPLCGMGICFECRLTIDKAPHVRSCLVKCRDGMEIETGQ